jgi:hypothetical protein
MRREDGFGLRIERLAIRAYDDVAAPAAKEWRKLRDGGTVTEDGECLIADLPAVAIGAMEDRASPERIVSGDGRVLVDDSGREEHCARCPRATVIGLDDPVVVATVEARDGGGVPTHGGIGAHLIPRDGSQLGGCDALAGEKIVDAFGYGVPGPSTVDDDDRPTSSA